jgi:hypothetical protein
MSPTVLALVAPLASTRVTPRGRVRPSARAIVRARACIPACRNNSRETTNNPRETTTATFNTRPLFPASARARARRPAAAAPAVVVAAAVTAERSPVPIKTLILGVLFAGWYACNIVFNICNKQGAFYTKVFHPSPGFNI